MKKILFILLLLPVLAKAQYCGPYTTASPIYYVGAHDMVIKSKSITGLGTWCIKLENCSNITIKYCKLVNGLKPAIRLDHCHNITIDSNYIANIASGLYAFRCDSNIRFRHNMILNIIGAAGYTHAAQMNECNGPGNEISYNNIDIAIGDGDNPNPLIGDILNLYKSNGTPASPIKVYYNNIRGGGTATGTLGAAGIVAGDVGGSYQDVEYNKLVSTGYVGIQLQGGTYITIKNNQIHSPSHPWSGVGLASANYSGAPSHHNVISDNIVNWKAGYLGMGRRDTSYKPGKGNNTCERPVGWKKNKIKTAMDESILPAVLIPNCNVK